MKYPTMVRWWIIRDEYGEPAGLRGLDDYKEDRFELYQKPNSSDWECLVVVHHVTDDGWGFRHVKTGTILECMLAAERYSQQGQD